jgi:hypothetical protein
MISPSPADSQPLQADDSICFPSIFELEGNFISSILSDPSPSNPQSLLPYPYACILPDASRTLTRLTQRVVLDVSTRKQGPDAYASSSTDAEEAASSSFYRSAQVERKGGAKMAATASACSAAAAVASATTPAPSSVSYSACESRRGIRLKKSVVVISSDEELDGFVRPDSSDVSE